MLRFTMLASGSGGNAALVEATGFGLLLDSGLGPRQLEDRLGRIGRSWTDVHAVLLTHTHSDHWNDRTLGLLHRRGLPFYCHPGHHRVLASYSSSFAPMQTEGLIRSYEEGGRLQLAPGLVCTPFGVRHDSGPTFGFRIEGPPDLFGQAPTLGYACDLGCWDESIAAALIDTDALAIEFNHDVEMEATSGRQPRLIARVLGDEGHLSNDQAASLLATVLSRSIPGQLQHLVQLHLSHQCNRPALAREAAQQVLAELAPEVKVHTASQDHPGSALLLRHTGKRPRRKAVRAPRVSRPAPLAQGWLFGPEQG